MYTKNKHGSDDKKHVYLDLFLTFAKIGAISFGGGYAMLAFLQREIVEKKEWATNEEMADYFAIGQCTPGIIAVNTATFIGQKYKGILGGIIATLGVVFPSILIISIIAAFFKNFSDITVVKNAFIGIRACVCALIVNAVIKLWKQSVADIPAIAIFISVFALSVFFGVSSVVLVIVSGIAGIIINNVRRGIKR
jgi:chromate transporter